MLGLFGDIIMPLSPKDPAQVITDTAKNPKTSIDKPSLNPFMRAPPGKNGASWICVIPLLWKKPM